MLWVMQVSAKMDKNEMSFTKKNRVAQLESIG